MVRQQHVIIIRSDTSNQGAFADFMKDSQHKKELDEWYEQTKESRGPNADLKLWKSEHHGIINLNTTTFFDPYHGISYNGNEINARFLFDVWQSALEKAAKGNNASFPSRDIPHLCSQQQSTQRLAPNPPRAGRQVLQAAQYPARRYAGIEENDVFHFDEHNKNSRSSNENLTGDEILNQLSMLRDTPNQKKAPLVPGFGDASAEENAHVVQQSLQNTPKLAEKSANIDTSDPQVNGLLQNISPSSSGSFSGRYHRTDVPTLPKRSNSSGTQPSLAALQSQRSVGLPGSYPIHNGGGIARQQKAISKPYANVPSVSLPFGVTPDDFLINPSLLTEPAAQESTPIFGETSGTYDASTQSTFPGPGLQSSCIGPLADVSSMTIPLPTSRVRQALVPEYGMEGFNMSNFPGHSPSQDSGYVPSPGLVMNGFRPSASYPPTTISHSLSTKQLYQYDMTEAQISAYLEHNINDIVRYYSLNREETQVLRDIHIKVFNEHMMGTQKGAREALGEITRHCAELHCRREARNQSHSSSQTSSFEPLGHNVVPSFRTQSSMSASSTSFVSSFANAQQPRVGVAQQSNEISMAPAYLGNGSRMVLSDGTQSIAVHNSSPTPDQQFVSKLMVEEYEEMIKRYPNFDQSERRILSRHFENYGKAILSGDELAKQKARAAARALRPRSTRSSKNATTTFGPPKRYDIDKSPNNGTHKQSGQYHFRDGYLAPAPGYPAAPQPQRYSSQGVSQVGASSSNPYSNVQHGFSNGPVAPAITMNPAPAISNPANGGYQAPVDAGRLHLGQCSTIPQRQESPLQNQPVNEVWASFKEDEWNDR